MALSPSEAALIVGATPRRSRFQIDKTVIIAYAFIAPAVFGFLIFYLVPTFRAIYISFTDWNLLRIPKVVGWANYDRLIHDKNFWAAMWITLLYVIYNIPPQLVFGLVLAVLLQRISKSVTFRSLFLAPYLLSNVIVAMLWFWTLDPILGFGNAVLGVVWNWSYRVLQRSEPGFADDRGGEHLATHRFHGIAVLYRASEYSA
jgi:multiple sugar transport system permease protein